MNVGFAVLGFSNGALGRFGKPWWHLQGKWTDRLHSMLPVRMWPPEHRPLSTQGKGSKDQSIALQLEATLVTGRLNSKVCRSSSLHACHNIDFSNQEGSLWLGLLSRACSEHIIFKLVSLTAERYDRATNSDLVAIMRHMVTVDPGLLHKR